MVSVWGGGRGEQIRSWGGGAYCGRLVRVSDGRAAGMMYLIYGIRSDVNDNAVLLNMW